MCRFLFPPVIIFYLSLSGDHFVHGGDNYPASFLNPKPCARLQNVILYRQPICVDDGHGGYIPETVANCQGSFKQTCPEFNQAECMRYGKDNRACCRLKYYAERSTWMEVYYSMQYDSTQYDGKINPNDIIEINRLIKKPEDFGNRHQEDYPKNVQDASGERGLTWHYVDKLKNSSYKEFSTYRFNPNDCLENKENADTCDIKEYVEDQYPEGFDPKSNKIELSKHEKDKNAVVTTTFSDPRCIAILINRTVVGACQIVYTRESYTEEFWTNFTVSEINFYRDPKNKLKDSPVRARYAYYPLEDKEMRDQIYSGPSFTTTTADPPPVKDDNDLFPNIQDASGERGLKWHYVDKVKDSLYHELTEYRLSPNDCLEKATAASCDIKSYVTEQYPEGFDPKSNKIELSKHEKDKNAVVTTTFSDPRCIAILINRTVVGACQIVYTRESYTEEFWTNFTVSEINFYRDPKNKSKNSPVRARYAYYPLEDKEMRDQIYSGPSHPTTTAEPAPPPPKPKEEYYDEGLVK